MKTIEIRRIATGPDGTPGVIKYKNWPFIISLEPEWKDNRPASPGVQGSCIPAGTYICKRVDSPKYGDTFEITDVQNRTHVLFHWGNFEDNSEACILTGEKFEPVDGRRAIQESKTAFKQLMKLMENDDEFRVIIVDDWKTDLNP